MMCRIARLSSKIYVPSFLKWKDISMSEYYACFFNDLYIVYFSVEMLFSNVNNTYKTKQQQIRIKITHSVENRSSYLLKKVVDIFLVAMKEIGHLSRFWLSCLGPLVFLLTKILKLFGFQSWKVRVHHGQVCVLLVSILSLLRFFYCILELFWQCGVFLFKK